MTHTLKIWPQYFEPVRLGIKTFEFRVNDRNYQVGDTLVLKEWDPDVDDFNGQYTGRALNAEVTYLIRLGDFDLPNYVVMAIKLQPEAGEEK